MVLTGYLVQQIGITLSIFSIFSCYFVVTIGLSIDPALRNMNITKQDLLLN